MPIESHPRPTPTRRTPFRLAVARIWASLFPATEAEAAIVADQIRLTRGATPLIDVLMPVAAALIAFSCRQWVGLANMIVWVGAVALSCAGTSLAAYLTDPMLEGDANAVRRAAQIRTAGTAAFLAAWAGMGIALWVPDDPVNHMLLLLMLATTLAGASSLLAAHPASVASALAVLGGMLVLRPAVSGTPLDLMLSALAVVFCVLMGGQVQVVYAVASRARELEFDRHKIVDELRHAKAESDRDRSQAVKAGRTRSQFLANMSHELRTPLNAILGFSEIIKGKAFGDNVERYSHYAGIIHESGGQLLQLIDDMLDLARIEGGRLTLQESVFALGALVHEIADAHHAKAVGAELTLGVEIDPRLPAIEADERAIRTILTNLLSNAVKFTPPGGRIMVIARLESDGRIALTVKDTGVGIAPEDQLVVFERFGLRRPDIAITGEGTGLGLAVVKGFTEAHDGEVALESAPGIGTRVSVFLPAWRARENQAGSRAAG